MEVPSSLFDVLSYLFFIGHGVLILKPRIHKIGLSYKYFPSVRRVVALPDFNLDVVHESKNDVEFYL